MDIEAKPVLTAQDIAESLSWLQSAAQNPATPLPPDFMRLARAGMLDAAQRIAARAFELGRDYERRYGGPQ